MAVRLVQRFQAELDRLRRLSGSINEQTIRAAFRDMLRDWSRSIDLTLLEEQEFETKRGSKVYPDGTVVHSLRVPLGYWEAKDTNDNLDDEIGKKTAKGYPTSNIIYENSKTAVLLQNGVEIARCSMGDAEALAELLRRFFAYERQEIRDFRRAVAQFQDDLPHVLDALRERIATAYNNSTEFRKKAADFLEHIKDTINPALGEADVREMLIQHILTEEIFNHVFNEADFHRENNVAQQLYALEAKFFRGAVKKDTLHALEPYYAAIRTAAASISAHNEKQKFLKVIYEGFYKAYNPKAADRLGVVYTPTEIVRFMIDGADWLCREHFGRGLIDENVDILDPCTGTGTYICELLETFRGDPGKLAYKYKMELHANEMAILPYYVANLNIEATYAAIAGTYAEYPSLCFVDTLDNIAALGLRKGHQADLFAGVSDENVQRVKRQNSKTISVVIGNPPYNANQLNENDNNKNRAYPSIDEAIKNSYVKASTAQKTKVYDMYARFFRWATDRLEDNGIIAFITNRSFIDSRTFDGFRRIVAEDFAEIWIVDLGGDVRANPKLSGPRHNVFAIQTGVAISFFVRKSSKTKRNTQRKINKPQALIRYARRPELEEAEDKLTFLAHSSLSELEMTKIVPGEGGKWINKIENEWGELSPIADRQTKTTNIKGQERAIFKLYSLGIITARDEWVYDFDKASLEKKAKLLNKEYNRELKIRLERAEDTDDLSFNEKMKWTRAVKNDLKNGRHKKFDANFVETSLFRPFVEKELYSDPGWNEMRYQLDAIFGYGSNPTITFLSVFASHEMSCLAVDRIFDYGLLKKGNGGTQSLPRYRYNSRGDRIDNITDWALRQFRNHYGNSKISKDDIFYYCYGVLHDPIYRETYSINLKQDFPRIRFQQDFRLWAGWGEKLMAMHIGFQDVKPWPLKRVDECADVAPRPILKSIAPEDLDAIGSIRIDTHTTLEAVPKAAWRYRLGNRPAIDWILDQYKEQKQRDPIIREKFSTYRFADYKEGVVDLLAKVTRISVDTVSITDQMTELQRGLDD